MTPTDDDYRVTAEAEYLDLDGSHKFDSRPDVTRSEGGAWVAAWVWVSDGVVENDA